MAQSLNMHAGRRGGTTGPPGGSTAEAFFSWARRVGGTTADSGGSTGGKVLTRPAVLPVPLGR